MQISLTSLDGHKENIDKPFRTPRIDRNSDHYVAG